jgi:hypothetical protein
MASKKKASKKKVAAKKGAPKRKIDGKALAAQRKPRDSVAQFIKDELMAGRTDVDRIIEKAKDNFPKSKPTRGYVRFIAKQIGKYKQVEPEGGAPAKAEKPAKAKSKKAAKKKAAATESKSESKDEAPAVDPAS